MMNLNIQLFGGRGASSSNSKSAGTSLESFNNKTKDVKLTINMDKTFTFMQKQGKNTIVNTLSQKDSKERLKNVSEAVVKVDLGMLEKRQSMLKDMGFKVISKTTYKKNAPKYEPVFLHIKKGN